MSEDECVDAIKNYDIKKSGVQCTVKEAQNYYMKVFKQAQLDIVRGVGYALDNFGQNIPINKITASDLELILDDCDVMSNHFTNFKKIAKFLWEVYHNPKDYDAWCGKVEDNVVYVIEKRNKKVTSINELMFV